ncbi:MAG: hypothetical protein HKP58_06035 [Desulfatitalea sp.]|nr:hypothetical protein [Desulfatitalea sp.]NNJ99955.1 hypothetical protein [Desulfatitalea sp.]
MAKKSTELSKQPEGIRLPILRTHADIDASSHLTEEEKAMAKDNLTRVPPSDGWYMLENDPEMQALANIHENGLIGLLDPDFQGIKGGPMNLVCLELARLTGCEWMASFLAKIGMTSPLSSDDWDPAQLAVLSFPDSKLWSENQRLALKFIGACYNHAMTDELFEQARKAWGEKRVLRFIFFIGYVNTWAMVENACNLTFTPVSSEAKVAANETEKLGIDDVRKGLKALWNSKQKFIP